MDNYDSESNSNSKNSKTKGFFSYVIDFNEQRKQELINLGQYVTLGFIFYTIIIFVIDKYFPKIDDSSSSIEIVFTLLLYLYILFYSVYFLNFIVKSSLTTIDSAFTNVSQEFNFLYISD